jgi:hypothetical protein
MSKRRGAEDLIGKNSVAGQVGLQAYRRELYGEGNDNKDNKGLLKVSEIKWIK